MKGLFGILALCAVNGIACSLLLDAHVFGPAMNDYLSASRGIFPCIVIMAYGISALAKS